MNASAKNIVIRTLAVAAIAVSAMGSANAAIFVRTAVVVTPVAVVAPLRVAVAAPVVVTPAPIVVAPAPVIVPLYVPACRFVAVPVMNAFTGITYLVTRRVCN